LEVRNFDLDCAIARVWRKNQAQQHTPNLRLGKKTAKEKIQDADLLGLLTDLDSGDDMVRLFSTISGITCEYPFVSMARRTKICAF
jgi:hypothetical protein